MDEELDTNRKPNMETNDEDNHKDQPWSLVVALASFLAQGMVGGHVNTTGIFYTVFIQQFPQTSEVAISWMCAMPLTLWFLGSPIGSVLVNRYGCRTCSLIGGLLASVGLSLCFVTTNFYLIFLFYGVLAGVGNGIYYVGFVTSVSLYFKKYRPIANIISTIGLTFGMAIYAALLPLLNKTYSWQGALLITGGISLNACALACTLFPTPAASSRNKTLNIRLLKDKHILLFGLHLVMCNMSSGVMFLHLPALLMDCNFTGYVSALSLTVYGISNCFAKVVFSMVAYACNPDSGIIYTVSLSIFGCVMMLLVAYPTEEWIVICVVILGCTYSVSGGHYLEVIYGLVGLDNLTEGLGFSQTSKAAGSLLTGPFAGLMYEISNSYRTSFFTGGAVMIASCIVMIPVNVRLKRVTRNQTADQIAVVSTKTISSIAEC